MTEGSQFQLFTSLRYDVHLLNMSWNSWPGNPPSPLFWLPYHLDRLIQAAQQFDWPAATVALLSGSDSVDRTAALERLRNICQDCADKNHGSERPLRIRVTLSREGELKADAFPAAVLPWVVRDSRGEGEDGTQPGCGDIDCELLLASTFNPDVPGSRRPARVITAYLDTEPTPASVFTQYKTTARAHYDAARARAGLSVYARTPGASASAHAPAPAPAPAPLEEVILHNTEGYVTEGSVRNVAFWRGGRWVTPRLEKGCLAGTVRRWLLACGRVVEGDVRRDDVRVGEWVLFSNAVDGCVLGVVTERGV